MAQKAQKYIQHNYTWEKITADNLSVYSQEFEIGQVENSTNDSPAEYSETKVAQSLKS